MLCKILECLEASVLEQDSTVCPIVAQLQRCSWDLGRHLDVFRAKTDMTSLFKVRFSEHNKNLLARWNQEQLIRLVRRLELRKGLGRLVNHGVWSAIIQNQSTDIITSWWLKRSFAEKKVLPGAWKSLWGCNRWSQKLGCKVDSIGSPRC